jgi:hypothetical protein
MFLAAILNCVTHRTERRRHADRRGTRDADYKISQQIVLSMAYDAKDPATVPNRTTAVKMAVPISTSAASRHYHDHLETSIDVGTLICPTSVNDSENPSQCDAIR